MDWQLLTVIVAIGVAGAYLLRRAWRTVAGRKGGCGGCGGAPREEGTFVPVGQLTLRRRD